MLGLGREHGERFEHRHDVRQTAHVARRPKLPEPAYEPGARCRIRRQLPRLGPPPTAWSARSSSRHGSTSSAPEPTPCAAAAARSSPARRTIAPAATAARPAAPPRVTGGVVLTAIRRIGLPSLTARTQPKDKTLVNFATIFYTEPHPFTRSVTLLGQRVRITATPDSFTWHYGDGTSSQTATPGAPYPAKDVTHHYTDAHTTVLTSVDVTYTARFQVANSPWQDIPGTVTIPGPSAPLRVSEATAMLSGTY